MSRSAVIGVSGQQSVYISALYVYSLELGRQDIPTLDLAVTGDLSYHRVRVPHEGGRPVCVRRFPPVGM